MLQVSFLDLKFYCRRAQEDNRVENVQDNAFKGPLTNIFLSSDFQLLSWHSSHSSTSFARHLRLISHAICLLHLSVLLRLWFQRRLYCVVTTCFWIFICLNNLCPLRYLNLHATHINQYGQGNFAERNLLPTTKTKSLGNSKILHYTHKAETVEFVCEKFC